MMQRGLQLHKRCGAFRAGALAPPRVATVLPRLRAVANDDKVDAAPAPQQAQPAATKSTQDLVKDAFQELNSDTMTTASLMGEANFAKLQQALGEDKVRQISGVLDPILKNRRAITVISAVIDVALIIAGIKLFQNVTSSGAN